MNMFHDLRVRELSATDVVYLSTMNRHLGLLQSRQVNTKLYLPFLPHDAKHSEDYAVTRHLSVSVCLMLSVRLSTSGVKTVIQNNAVLR